ncbi:MAG TPA: histidine kinase [Kofleriaceae bacterium]
MTELATMTLVHGERGGHARAPMRREVWIGRLRGLAIIAGVWTVVVLFNLLSVVLRSRSGELHPAPGWLTVTVAVLPIWTALTVPILMISRRFPIERHAGRRSLAIAIAVHAAALAGAMAIDGLASMWISPGPLTLWQQMWRYSIFDAVFYGGIVAVEHAGRYHRLYLDRRIRASELEAQVSRAQLHALQMQIRPHFLFNALNTISGLVRIDDKAAAVTMLAGLGDLLRMLLRSDGAQEVAVRQELDLIERYLQIEQVRFGDRLAVEVTVDPEVEAAMIPNLILQPLVENAVRHGIRAAAGRVTVAVSRAGAVLRMEVCDASEHEPGARPHDRDAERGGIGLANTRARLERLYGAAYRFELAQHASGASAVIELPLRGVPGAA